MQTLFIGKNLIFLPEVHSTNSYANDLLKNVNLPEGTVVYTANQTHGKGQRGSAWKADPAMNLTASVILKPGFLDIQKQFFLYQVAALACYDAMTEILNTSQIDIKIKWPNDILVNRKKIGGILIENTIQNNQINSSVIGIGLNINQVNFEGAIKATSLKLLAGKEYQVEEVLKIVCTHLEKHYLSLLNTRLINIKENYMQHLFGLNEILDFEIEGEIKSLRVKDIAESGLLLLEDADGTLREMDVKEIKWLY